MIGSTSQAKPGYSRTSADIDVVDGWVLRLSSSQASHHTSRAMVLGA